MMTPLPPSSIIPSSIIPLSIIPLSIIPLSIIPLSIARFSTNSLSIALPEIARVSRLGIVLVVMIVLATQACCHHRVAAEPAGVVSPLMRGWVPSWPIDLTMTREDELAIVRRLLAPCPPMPSSMTLGEFASQLNSVCPAYLDVVALRGIGLGPDDLVQPLSARAGTTWISQLITTLQSVDLTVQLQHNVLHLTTEEEAQNRYPTRAYNITSLIGAGDVVDQRAGVDSLMQLVQTHVSADSWEMLGGMGTMTASFHQDETLLTVSASTPMHWQIQTLLNQLVVAGKVPILDSPSNRTPSNRKPASRFILPPATPAAVASGSSSSALSAFGDDDRTSGLPNFQP